MLAEVVLILLRPAVTCASTPLAAQSHNARTVMTDLLSIAARTISDASVLEHVDRAGAEIVNAADNLQLARFHHRRKLRRSGELLNYQDHVLAHRVQDRVAGHALAGRDCRPQLAEHWTDVSGRVVPIDRRNHRAASRMPQHH